MFWPYTHACYYYDVDLCKMRACVGADGAEAVALSDVRSAEVLGAEAGGEEDCGEG